MFAIAQGLLTAYEDRGAGPTVLLLHGLGASGASFAGVARRLEGRYRLLVPDLMGHGRTDKPPGSYSPSALADHLCDLLRKLGVENVHGIVGHSLGGCVAVELSARLVGLRRLCLVDPPPPAGAKLFAALAALSGGARLAAFGSAFLPNRRLARLWLRFLFADPSRLDERILDHYARGADARGSAAATVSALGSMAKLSLPLESAPRTLLLWGAEDPIFPPSTAAAWQRRLPLSELLVLPAVGHCPPEEAPAAVAAALLGFLPSSSAEATASASPN